MNQRESGFCQECRALIEISPFGCIEDHGSECKGRFHRPATLVFGPGWVSWTIGAGPFARSVLVDPIDPQVLADIRRIAREN